VAELTTAMLKDGGTRSMTSAEVLRRVETLGSDLLVRTESDASVLGLALTKDTLDAGLSILSEVVREPRFDPEELRRLRSRATDDAANAARASGTWTATWLMFRELFPPKAPYAIHDALPSQLAKVDLAAIRDFHRHFFVPKAATLVLAGDVDEATAKDLAQRHFGAWTGGEPPRLDFPPPRLPNKRRIVLAHRPKSVQSDVLVAVIAAPRHDQHWPAVRVANQVLGGGVASRLFSDVREQRSLAYATHSQIQELAHGPQPLVLDAGTQSSRTADAVSGLLENLLRLSTSPPSPTETVAARRFLDDVFAIRMETTRAIAELVVTQETFGLPPDYWDQYRGALRDTDATAAADAVSTLDAGHAVVVVAGDADIIGPSLARMGDVDVVDPEKEFKPMRTIAGVKE
jgi:predicted Zn-dependent peptidase